MPCCLIEAAALPQCSPVLCVAADGGVVCCGTAAGQVAVWDFGESADAASGAGSAPALIGGFGSAVCAVALRRGCLFACGSGAVVCSDVSVLPSTTETHWSDAADVLDLSAAGGGAPAAACALSGDACHAAAAVGARCLVFELAEREPVALLEGHAADVQHAAFLGGAHGQLATAAADRTFKVWNFLEGCLLFQSSVLGAHPALAIAEQCAAQRRLFVGCGDGSLRVFAQRTPAAVSAEASQPQFWEEVWQEDLAAAAAKGAAAAAAAAAPDVGPWVAFPLTTTGTAGGAQPRLKVVSSLPPWQRPAAGPAASGAAAAVDDASGSLGHGVVALHAVECGGRRKLLAITQHAVLLVDADSYRVQPLMPRTGPFAAACAAPQLDGTVRCVAAGALQPELRVLSLIDTDQQARDASEAACAPGAAAELSVFGRRPLPAAMTTPLLPLGADAASAAAAAHSKRPALVQRKVQSSGYAGSVPWSVQQQQRKKRQQQQQQQRRGEAVELAHGVRPYPRDSGPPSELQKAHNAALDARPLHCGALIGACYTADAKGLVAAAAESAACVLRLPPARHGGDAHVLRGHTGPVLSCAASYTAGDGALVLTSGADGTCRLWRPGRDKALLCVTAAPPTTGAPPPEVRAVRFFYVDRLLAAAAGGTVALHKYVVDTTTDDLDKHTTRSRAKAVHSFGTGCQAVNALSCHNAFASPLLFYVGSDKTAGVYDVSAQRLALVRPGVHQRPPHAVAVPSESHCCSLPRAAMEVYATAAPDGCVRLWDLRQPDCVRAFSAHQNRTHRCGVALSPCLRFLATGSEDRCTYLYDLGGGGVIARVLSHGDTVSDVAFSPLHPQLCAVGHDGRVRFLADRAG